MDKLGYYSWEAIKALVRFPKQRLNRKYSLWLLIYLVSIKEIFCDFNQARICILFRAEIP